MIFLILLLFETVNTENIQKFFKFPFALNCLEGQGSNHCLHVYNAKLTIFGIVIQCFCHLAWNGYPPCCQALCGEWSLSVTAFEAQPEIIWESASLFRMKSWQGLLKHFEHTHVHTSKKKTPKPKQPKNSWSWQCLIY